MSKETAERELVRTITLPQAVALYAGAVIGAGVLILPGVAASEAGPASLVAWTFDGVLGIPLALTFAALAARYPDAGGVAVYTSKAFGAGSGAVVGWFYFFAAAIAQALVSLTGAHYIAGALHVGRDATFAMAAAILAVSVVANMFGLRLSARIQLVLSAAVALVLVAATIAAIPNISFGTLSPFDPHGPSSIGRATILLFFAFFGWEAITHLSAEFRDPARDVPRATFLAVALVTSIYLGVAFAVVSTGTYGDPQLDRIAVARLLSNSLGVGAEAVAAAAAVIITLGTTNAFVAATSRLGYALGRDEAFPRPLGRLDERGVPRVSIGVVAAFAVGGLVVAYAKGWGAEKLLVVPNSLVIATYLIAMAAAIRLLEGRTRLLAVAGFVLCAGIFPFAGASLILPAVVGAAALVYRSVGTFRRRRGYGRPAQAAAAGTEAASAGTVPESESTP